MYERDHILILDEENKEFIYEGKNIYIDKVVFPEEEFVIQTFLECTDFVEIDSLILILLQENAGKKYARILILMVPFYFEGWRSSCFLYLLVAFLNN